MKIFFSHKEEVWNSWSHAAGIILGVVVGTAFLVWCGWARNGWATAGIILYLFGMLSSYIASTVYHALSHGRRGRRGCASGIMPPSTGT